MDWCCFTCKKSNVKAYTPLYHNNERKSRPCSFIGDKPMMDNFTHLNSLIENHSEIENGNIAAAPAKTIGFCNCTNLQSNYWAEIFICHRESGDFQDHCINIYISNNVQIVNSFILLVRWRQEIPEVKLSLRDLEVECRILEEHKRGLEV